MRGDRAISAEIAGPVTFGLIPREHWYQPDWIDEDKASASRADMVASNVIYGGASVLRNAFESTSLTVHTTTGSVSYVLLPRSLVVRAILDTFGADIATCAGSTLA